MPMPCCGDYAGTASSEMPFRITVSRVRVGSQDPAIRKIEPVLNKLDHGTGEVSASDSTLWGIRASQEELANERRENRFLSVRGDFKSGSCYNL